MDSASEEVPPSALEPTAMEPNEPAPENLPDISLPPHAPQFRAGISDDLRVPWGWLEVALFVILGVIGSVVVTWGLAQIAVRFFGANPNEVFGETMSTAKSVVVLVSQAMLDGFAILYLYLMLVARTPAPFWQSIGWREMRPGAGKIRDSALQFLAGGAVLAVVVSFTGGFLNSKETLPIEELLKARVSILLFGILGVLVAPLVEETIFRGFLYPVIARRLGIAAGIAVTGTLFGLMHAAQLWGGWGQIALLILVGVVLTWVRARTGTVAASYFVHLGYNGLQLVGYLIYVVSGSHH
ncbi:MAG TPA: CPBP family intramembrane glutamic endopeptidase [Candidatus Acidoferrales bacterium]|nr:CPBP family intramembrane glutamic endopeptidase [Candidatus Acidoferrales bacterium]